jgi:hypothetical protein
MPQISTPQFRFLFLIAVLFLCPASVAAIPIADYHNNLKQAITALDTLLHSDEEETPADYETRFTQTIEAVRNALPPNQTIELNGEVRDVDNSWFHKALDELNEVVDRPEKIEHILGRLQALEARIAEGQQSGGPAERKDQAKSRLESILARPEYVRGARGPNALTRLIQDFFRWLRDLFPAPKPSESGQGSIISLIAQFAVIIGALVVLGYVLKILLTRFKRSRKHKTPKKREARVVLGERLDPEDTAADLLSEAEALARQGDLRAAIRKGYIALLVELGDRKLISLAQHKTNRDYLNSLRSAPQLHSKMRGLTDSFERHWYGFVQADQNDWQNFRSGYLAALQTETN